MIENVIGFIAIGGLIVLQIVIFAYGYGKLSGKVDAHTKLINGNDAENRETHGVIFGELRGLEKHKADK